MMKVIILAAGKGTRLLPFTRILPKPLLPLGDYSILEILIRQVARCGFDDITVTTFYLAELIELYVEKLQRQMPHVHLQTHRSPGLLGTAGGISAIPGLGSEPFMVINGDVLTNVDYGAVMAWHNTTNAAMTISTYQKPVKVHLGVIETDSDGLITSYLEKPESTHTISMGIYVYSPDALSYMQTDTFQDVPDLVRTLLSAGKKVVSYRQEGIHWLDIGRLEDFTHAQDEFERLKNLLLPD